MRKRPAPDPKHLQLVGDAQWFLDAACPDRQRLSGETILVVVQEVFGAVERQINVDYLHSFSGTIFATTQLGSAQLRYARSVIKDLEGLSKEVRRVLHDPKTKVVTDRPQQLVYVYPEEAVHLSGWGCPVVVWAPSSRPTFWARQEDMAPIITLRALRKDFPD